MKDIFRYQIWHFAFVLISLVLMQNYLVNNVAEMQDAWWGISTKTWFWVAIATPIVHQIYVWLIWRIELYQHAFTSRYGLVRSFKFYTIGFSLLFAGRLIFIIALSLSQQDSLSMNPDISYLLTAIIIPIVLFLAYSVKRYFTFERAFGIDHFDKNFNKPFVKEGIFRFTDNGMYFYGLLVLYLPGLLLFSKAALIVALFNHVYIWVHYYCTERPDMEVIYGKLPNT